MRLLFVAALGLMLLAGCESDAAKLERLQTDEVHTRLFLNALERQARTNASAALADSVRIARGRWILAERELRRFLD